MSKRKLLLADDSITIQKVVNLTFADEGIEVITVGDGDSAMQKISEMSPDVILADVNMPGLNGYQICEIIRDNPVTRHLPVVLLVGSFEPFDEAEAARVGANAYLTKPFQSIRQLVSQVTDLMESSAATSETLPLAEQDFHESLDGLAPEVNDIDNLYQKSFGGSAGDEIESGSPRFVDAGMDDEMIDTRSVTDTETLQAIDSTQEGDYTPGDFEAVQGEAETSTGSFEEPVVEEAAEDRFADEMLQTPPYVDQFAATEQIPALTVEQYRNDFDLDDSDLLELPPGEIEKTLEFTTPQSPAEQGGTKQVVSLSPELMETIVQQVVEKLSKMQ